MNIRSLLIAGFVLASVTANAELLIAEIRIQRLPAAYSHFDRDPLSGDLAGVLVDGSAVHRLGNGNGSNLQKPGVVWKASDLRGVSYGYYLNKLRLFSAINQKSLLILDPAGQGVEEQIELPPVDILALQKSTTPDDVMVWLLVRSSSGKSLAGVNLSTKAYLPDVLNAVSHVDISDNGRTITALRTSGRLEIYDVESTGVLSLVTELDGALPNSEVVSGRHQIRATVGDRLWLTREFTPLLEVGQLLAIDRLRPFAYAVHRRVVLGKGNGQPTFEVRAVSANSRAAVGRAVAIPAAEGIAAEESVPLIARSYGGSWFVDTDEKNQSLLLAFGNRLFVVPIADLQLPDHRLLTLQDESPKSFLAGSGSSFPLVPSDKVVRVSLTGSPDGLGVVNNTVAWTPRADQVGDHILKLELKHGDFVRSLELPLKVTLGGVTVPVEFGLSCQDPRSLSVFVASQSAAVLHRLDIRRLDDPQPLRSIPLPALAQEIMVKRYKDHSWLLVTTNEATILAIDVDSLKTVGTFQLPKESKARLVVSRNESDPWGYAVVMKSNGRDPAGPELNFGISFIDFRVPALQIRHLQPGQGFMLEPNGRGAWIRENLHSRWQRAWQLQTWDSAAPVFRNDGTVADVKFGNESPEYSWSGRTLQVGDKVWTSDLQTELTVRSLTDGKQVHLPDRDAMIRLFSKSEARQGGNATTILAEVIPPDTLTTVSEPIPVESVETHTLSWQQFQSIRVYKSARPNEYLVYCGKRFSELKIPKPPTSNAAPNSAAQSAAVPLTVGDNVVFRIGVENELAVSAVDVATELRLADGPSGAVYKGGKIRWRPEIDQVGNHKLNFELTSGDQTQRQSVDITAQFAAHRFINANNIFRFDRESGLLAVKGTTSDSIEVFGTTREGLQELPLAVVRASFNVTDFTFARWGESTDAVLCAVSAESSRLEFLNAVSGASLAKVDLPVSGVEQISWSGNLQDDLIIYSGASAPPDDVRPFVCGLLSIKRQKSLGLLAKTSRNVDEEVLITTTDPQAEVIRWNQLPQQSPVRTTSGGAWMFLQRSVGQMPRHYRVAVGGPGTDIVTLTNVPAPDDAKYQNTRQLAGTHLTEVRPSFVAHPDLPLGVMDRVLLEPLSESEDLVSLSGDILTFLVGEPIGVSVLANPNSKEHAVSYRSFGFGQNENLLSSFKMTFDARSFRARPTVFHDSKNNQLLVCHLDIADAVPVISNPDDPPAFVTGSITGPAEVRIGEESRFQIVRFPKTATLEVHSLPKGAVLDGDEIRWSPTSEQIGTAALSIKLRNGQVTSEASLVVKVDIPMQQLEEIPSTVAYSERTGCLAIATNGTNSVVLRSAESGFSEEASVTLSVNRAQAVCCRPFAEKDYFVVASGSEKEVRLVDVATREMERTIRLPTDCTWLAASQTPIDPFVYYIDSDACLRVFSMATNESSTPLMTSVSGVSVASDGKFILVGFKRSNQQHDASRLFAVDWNADSAQPGLRPMTKFKTTPQQASPFLDVLVYPAWSPGMVASSLDMLPLGNVASKSEIGRAVRYVIPENSSRLIRISDISYTYAPRNSKHPDLNKLLSIQFDSTPLDKPGTNTLRPLGKIDIPIAESGDRVEDVQTQIVSDRSRNLVLAIVDNRLFTLPLQSFLPVDERLLALQLPDTPEFVIDRETKIELTATADVELIEASSLPQGMTLQNRTLVWNARANQQGVHSADLTLSRGTQSRTITIAVRATTGHSTLPFPPAILAVGNGEKHLIAIGSYVEAEAGIHGAGTDIAVIDPVTGEIQTQRRIDEKVLNCLVNDDSVFISCGSENGGDSVIRRLQIEDLAESAKSSVVAGLRQLALSSSSLFAVLDDALLELSATDLTLTKRVGVASGTAVRIDDEGIWLGELLCAESLVPQIRSMPVNQRGELEPAVPTRASILSSGSFGASLSSTGDPANCSTTFRNSRYRLAASVEITPQLSIVKVRSTPLPGTFVTLGGADSQQESVGASVTAGEFALSLDSNDDNQRGLPICCGDKTVFVAFNNKLLRANQRDLNDRRAEKLASWPSFEMRQSSFAIDGAGTTQLTHKLTVPQEAIYQLESATPGLSIDAANGTVTVNEEETMEYAIQKLKRTLVSMTRGSEPVSGTFQKLLLNSPGLLLAPPNVDSSDQQRIFLPVAIAVQARVAGNRTTTLRYGILVSIRLDLVRMQLKELESQMLTTSSPSNTAKASPQAPSVASPNGTPATRTEDQSAQQRIDALEKRIENMESSLKTINTQLDTLIEVLKKKDSTGGNR